MTANARDWGVTILRLWIGFLIAYSGYMRLLNGVGLSDLFQLRSFSFHAWLNLGSQLIFLVGGAAILFGVAVRLASLITALATGFSFWEKSGLGLDGILESPHSMTILIVCVVLILTGPGRLNLGAAFRTRR